MATPLKPIARRALSVQSDERLVRLLRDGHEPAFEEVVRRYRAPLVAFATAIAGASGAEDVVQAGLMRAHSALLADRREITLRPWLFAIIRNGALNAVRDEPAWRELDPDLHEAAREPATVEGREEFDHLVNAICALPEAQRRALVMREMEGVGHAEIAAKLHTSPTAVRGLIFRARTTLRNALGALVPLPLLRWLLADPEAAAAATAAAATAGGGGAALGGALGKVVIGLTAAVVAVGAGKAIKDRAGHEREDADSNVARAAQSPGRRAAAGGGTDPEARDGAERDDGERGDERRDGERDDGGEHDGRDDRGDGDGGDGEPEGGSGGGGSPGGSSGHGGGHGGHSAPDDDDVEVDDADDDVEEADDDVEPPEIDDHDDGDGASSTPTTAEDDDGDSSSGSDPDSPDPPDDD